MDYLTNRPKLGKNSQNIEGWGCINAVVEDMEKMVIMHIIYKKASVANKKHALHSMLELEKLTTTLDKTKDYKILELLKLRLKTIEVKDEFQMIFEFINNRVKELIILKGVKNG